jgi:hypothetical protein
LNDIEGYITFVQERKREDMIAKAQFTKQLEQAKEEAAKHEPMDVQVSVMHL